MTGLSAKADWRGLRGLIWPLHKTSVLGASSLKYQVMPHSPMVFLSYAREDLDHATEIYHYLTGAGVNVWFDKECLRPGERWQDAIERAIKESKYFVAVISSRSAQKRGFVQAEIRRAIEVLDQTPDDDVFLIPVRLDVCRPPIARLADLNWLDLFPDKRLGLEKLVRFLVPTADLSVTQTIRWDGIYRSRRLRYSGSDYFKYLRFYGDGTVITVSANGKTRKVVRWFNRLKSELPVGHYRITGSSITFSAISGFGRVDYMGKVNLDSLVLESHSHINGHRSVEEYRFIGPIEMDFEEGGTFSDPT